MGAVQGSHVPRNKVLSVPVESERYVCKHCAWCTNSALFTSAQDDRAVVRLRRGLHRGQRRPRA
eukprot:7155202-Pyramimonas_sp.AAC.1